VWYCKGLTRDGADVFSRAWDEKHRGQGFRPLQETVDDALVKATQSSVDIPRGLGAAASRGSLCGSHSESVASHRSAQHAQAPTYARHVPPACPRMSRVFPPQGSMVASFLLRSDRERRQRRHGTRVPCGNLPARSCWLGTAPRQGTRHLQAYTEREPEGSKTWETQLIRSKAVSKRPQSR
jgi:hypothetical protein